MNELCKEHFPEQLKNLQTIPGIKERSATAIIAELGVDMKMFLAAAALVSWCGLKPRKKESARKIKSRKISSKREFVFMETLKSAKKGGIELHVSLLYISAMGEHKDKGGLGFIEEI